MVCLHKPAEPHLMSWIKLALALVSFVQWLTRTLHDNKVLAAGQTQAVADALRRASDEVTAAIEAGRKAEEDARKGKFDSDLFRDKPP